MVGELMITLMHVDLSRTRSERNRRGDGLVSLALVSRSFSRDQRTPRWIVSGPAIAGERVRQTVMSVPPCFSRGGRPDQRIHLELADRIAVVRWPSHPRRARLARATLVLVWAAMLCGRDPWKYVPASHCPILRC